MTLGTPLRQSVTILIAICASLAVFAAWPELDLEVTAFFQDAAGGFSGADTGWPNHVRLAIWRVSELVLIVAIGALIFGLLRRRDVLGVPRRIWAYILTLYTIGPGVLVDVVLKPLWGRARPANIVEFGGTLAFTPPYQFSGECTRNCSFVSGEVAGAVALAVALVLILRQFRHRLGDLTYRAAVALVLTIPVVSAWQRIAAGRHFLSDAVFATLFILLVAVLLHAAFVWVAARWGRH